MACGGGITEESFGCTSDGKPVTRYTMKNKAGVIVQVINYGATITSIQLPLKCGPTDIVLGFDDIKGYTSDKNPGFGSTLGRVANRTKPTKFKLDGQCVTLTANDPDDIHRNGGCKGFSKVVWEGKVQGNTLSMTYCSTAGEEGYPGNLQVTACFILTEDNNFCVNYKATTDAKTIVNLSNFSYFNLAGHSAGAAALLQHELQVEADTYARLCNKIATGDMAPVDCTAYDFRKPRMICEAMTQTSDDGFETNFALKPPTNCLKLAAILTYKPQCTAVEIYTTAPSLLLESGNDLDKIVGKNCSTYSKYAGLSLATQGFPNAANVKSFPPIELNAGDEYKHQILFKFKF